MAAEGELSEQMFCRVVTIMLIVLIRMGNYSKVDEALGELQERLRAM